MAVGNIRARVTLPYTTGISSDIAVNDLVFNGSDQPGDLEDLASAVISFYNVENAATGHQRPVAGYLSEQLSRASGVARVDMFKIGTPGSPIYSATFTLEDAPDATGHLAAETAAALSFHGEYGTLLPDQRARRRGRIFLGPLDRISGEVAAGGYRPSQQFINDCVNAAVEFLGTAAANVNYTWSVYSPTNNANYFVSVAGMDDAYDTMRSRGLAPTHRTEIELT